MKISNMIKIIMFLFIPAISLAQPYGYTGPSGGGAGGANTALSNLISTAINTSLNPGADSTISLGTSILRWNTLNAEQIVLTSDFMDTMTIDADSMTSDVSLTITGAGLSLNSGTTDLSLTTTGGSSIISLNTQAGGEININSDTLGFIDNTATQVDVYVARKTGGGAGIPLVISGSGATNGATDTNGGDITVVSGRSTGTGTSDIIFNTPTPQGGTNNTDNIPSTKFRINGTGKVIFGSGAVTTFWDPTNSSFQIGGTDYSFGPATTILPGNILSYDVAGNYATLGLSGEIVQIQGNGSLTGYAEITSLDDFRVNTTDGMVIGVNGSVSLPSIRTNDTNSGIWTPATDEVAVSTGATERARFRLSNSGAFTGRSEFQLGTMSGVANEYGFYTKSTGLNSTTTQYMNVFEGVGAGANTGEQHVFLASLTPGYTGAVRTSAVSALNASATTATASGAWGDIQGTIGTYSQATGTFTGHAFSVVGNTTGGSASSTNVGVFGRSSSTFANTHIGVAGVALSSLGGGVQIGGFFGIGDYGVTAPTWASGAVVGDVGAGSGIPIFRGRNAGVDRFRVMETGVVQIYSTGTISTPVLTFGPNAGPADTSTGIWRPGSNVLSFVNSGANTLYLAADNKVGVGTANSQSKLGVAGSVAIGATYADTVGSPTNGLAVQGDVGIGIITPTAQLHLSGVTGSSGYQAFWSGALGSDNNTRAGLRYSLTTAGTGASAFRLGIQTVLSGTSTDASAFVYGNSSEVSVPGVSSDLRLATGTAGPLGNVGSIAYAYGTTVGLNVGTTAVATNGNTNVAMLAKSTTAKNSASNIGVLSAALNTGSTPTHVGGYFGLVAVTPTLTSSALIADNGTTTSPIFLARDNGTTVFAINDAGVVIMTGDNSGGVGTLRIRPSDEDTQIVLCEASNNATTEVCSTLQHQNISASASTMLFASNMYLDSAGSVQRNNTAFGSAYIQSRSSSTLGSNTTVLGLYNTSGTLATYSDYSVTGTTAGTFTFGTSGTTTVDFRGPILNGGATTCNGLWAGSLCINENLVMQYSSSDLVYRMQSTSASGLSYIQVLNNSGSAAGSFGYGNTAYADADFAGHFWYLTNVASTPLRLGNTQDVTVTNPILKVTDNTAVSGTLEGTNHVVVYGGGTIAYPSTQTITCADNAGGTNQTANLDPQAHTITILNNDATGCDITFQETSAIIGAVIIVCIDPASTATNVNFADVANVFNGTAPALSQGDCFTARYFDAANDLWVQTGISDN